MARPLPKEIIQKARELVLCGNSKYSVSKQLGIGVTTIYKHTSDLPSNKHDRLDKMTIQRIREEVLQGKSKYQIAKDMNLRFGAVYYHTQDLPNHVYREEGIQGQTLDLLKELIKSGYIISTEENTQKLRRLKKYLPMVQCSQIDNKGIYYLSDKNKVALQSILQQKKSKIFSYQELNSIAKVFDTQLSKKEKQSFLLKKSR